MKFLSVFDRKIRFLIFNIYGELLKWPTRADCKSADYVFEGSNPSLTTIYMFDIDAGIAQWLEPLPSKQDVASSNLVSRSNYQSNLGADVKFLLLLSH